MRNTTLTIFLKVKELSARVRKGKRPEVYRDIDAERLARKLSNCTVFYFKTETKI